MSNDIDGIEDSDVILVIGSNTTETHPIIGLRMQQAVERRGAGIIVADPRRIKLVDHARLWLRQRPGTDVALINGMCHVIVRDNLVDRDFIKTRTENFETFAAAVAECTPEWAEKITGVPAADIEEAARIYASAERAGIFYTMGITQHTSGTDNVRSLANLALLTGNLGKHGAGLNPLRGQNNVQGASDMGCVPIYLPGYQPVTDEANRKRFEKLWGGKISDRPGLTATEMTQAMLDGRISAMWVMGENPVMSDPNANHAREAFQNVEFLVVQDIFLTETAELADVVLPAASFAEKEGTFTNTERRVQRVRQAVMPPGGARDDLTIIQMISERMDYGQGVIAERGLRPTGSATFAANASDVFAEIGMTWSNMVGINYDRLEKNGIQWPCPATDHPGTPFLFEKEFPIGRASFTSVSWKGPQEQPDDEYPFVLTTGRVLYQYHTGTMTRRSQLIENADSGPFIEINPGDAERLAIKNGDMVRVESRRGSVSLPVLQTYRVDVSVTYMPFHYREAAANLLTNDALDPYCKIPEAKVCAVRIETI